MYDWNKKRKVMQRYNSTAHIYDMRYSEEQTAKIKAALEILSITKGSLILDVGCGTGLLFSYVKDKAEMIVGLDTSSNVLLQASGHVKRSRNIHLILADADNMPLKGGIFSHLFAVTLIQNMPSPSETLNEMKRVAKKDAVIVVTGLKKKFAKTDFEELLQNATLDVISLKGKSLKCHVAVCIESSDRLCTPKLNYI